MLEFPNLKIDISISVRLDSLKVESRVDNTPSEAPSKFQKISNTIYATNILETLRKITTGQPNPNDGKEVAAR